LVYTGITRGKKLVVLVGKQGVGDGGAEQQDGGTVLRIAGTSERTQLQRPMKERIKVDGPCN